MRIRDTGGLKSPWVSFQHLWTPLGSPGHQWHSKLTCSGILGPQDFISVQENLTMALRYPLTSMPVVFWTKFVEHNLDQNFGIVYIQGPPPTFQNTEVVGYQEVTQGFKRYKF